MSDGMDIARWNEAKDDERRQGKPMTFEEIEKRMIKKHGLSEKMFKALKPAFEAMFEAGKDSALTELTKHGGKNGTQSVKKIN